MKTYRSNAITAGVLYIIGTVAGILSLVLSEPLRNAQDSLAGAAANANQVIVAALFVLLMCLSLAMVPVVLYPVLRRHSEVLALGYVVFRGALETVTGLMVPVAWLLLVAMGQSYVQAGAAAASGFQGSGALLLKAGEGSSTPCDRLLPGRLDVLCGVVSVTAGSSLDIRVGTRGAHSVPGRRIPGAVRPP